MVKGYCEEAGRYTEMEILRSIRGLGNNMDTEKFNFLGVVEGI